MKHVALIIPVYNEEGNIATLTGAIRNVFAGLSYDYSILFVDDGSIDGSLKVIRAIANNDERIKFISFSRNFGHQSALKAGLDKAEADCAITLDADLQHPPEVIPLMLRKWEEGYDVVYTIRKDNAEVGYIKKQTSHFFYSILRWLSNIDFEKGTPDFRLLSRPVLSVIKTLTENQIFLRGIVKWIGFKQVAIEYDQNKRTAGASKYTFKKMAAFALQGITAFSTRPLYAAAYLGFSISFLSLLYVPYVIYSYYFGHAVSGWASVIVTIAFFGGLQLTILGIIGLYLGKLFMQAKGRPTYIVRETNLYERR
jgi:dolichol-phosphate mannosyltransferase